MSRFQLKILAIVTMLIDHTGAILFPHILIFRMIGRLSFPIFAYLISEGLLHTSNVKKYMLRLLLFALISEVPFDLAFQGAIYYPQKQNIFFTLFLGLAAIAFLREYFTKNSVMAVAFAVAMAFFAEILHTDYGWFGVAVVILFYIYKNNRVGCVIAFVLLVAVYSLSYSLLEFFSVLSIVPILLYSGQKGRWSWKYFFYAFYPVHLLLLYFLHTVVI